MKMVSIRAVFCLSFMALSCNDAPKKSPPREGVSNENAVLKSEVAAAGVQCFLYANNKDSIKLSIKEQKTVVTGNLMYNFYEKDGSWGTFEGIMKGDTLFADYNFESEGMTSKRELILLRQGTEWLPGYGDMETDEDSTLVFTKNAQITFDKNTPLLPIDCAKINF